MALRFNNIVFKYGQETILNGINLVAKKGEITCLLGTSGSGKSTLLRLAAGMEKVQQGDIRIGENILASATKHTAPENRPVGMMFQESALFPHISIAENIAFGLSHLNKAEQQKIIANMLAMVDLKGFENRYPHSLSGGQQQRIALARSLAPQPEVLLMDEPYASIDVTLRRSLRESARLILKNNDTATILVTHDPQEAIEMADKIAVLDEGVIIQYGTPQELYETPNSVAVASIFANAQIISAKSSEQGYQTDYGMIHSEQKNKLQNGSCQLAIRPHGLNATADEQGECKVVDIRFIGNGSNLYLQPLNPSSPTPPLHIKAQTPNTFTVGDRVKLSATNNDFFIFNH